LEQTIIEGECAFDFIIIREWSATDLCGNTITHTQHITVVDTGSPVWAQEMPSDITVECHEIPEAPTGIVAIDNCDTDVVVSFNEEVTPGVCDNVYILTRTWTATDNCGNHTVHTQTITVEDNTAPVIVCTGNILAQADEGEDFATIEISIPEVTELCGSFTLTNDFTGTGDASGLYPMGITTVTWTAEDACGNASTCSFTVTVLDAEDPVIICPPTVIVNCTDEVPAPFASYEAFIVAGGEAWDNGEIDENSFVLISEISDQGSCPEIITRTYQIADDEGNTSVCSHMIIIHDEQAPVFTIIPEDLTLECDGEGNTDDIINWLNSAAASDNCGDVTITHNYTGLEAGCGATGAVTVMWTAEDLCGNTETVSATIIIADTTPPTFTVIPENTTAECDGEGNPTAFESWLSNVEATDVCSDVTIVHSIQQTDELCGTTSSREVIWTATDACGNQSSTSAVFTIVDTTPPSFDCPDNITANVVPGEIYAEISIEIPEVFELCGSFTLVNDFTGTEDASGQYPLGVTTVTYTAIDECGNETICSFTITVVDEESPEITCPEAIYVECIDEVPAPYASYEEFVQAGGMATDNNEIDESSFMLVSEISDNLSCPETITRVYRIADMDGNTATCSHFIIVHDEQPPVFSVIPEDLTVECNGDGNTEELNQWLANIAAEDNCSAVNITHDFTSMSNECGATGSATVTWTATDACGNISETTATFAIIDTTPPVFACIESQEAFILASEQYFTVQGNEYDPTDILDACGNYTAIHNLEHSTDTTLEGFNFLPGTTEVVWTITDECGNAATCSFTVTVYTLGLELTKTAGQQTYSNAGEQIDYTIVVANTGTGTLTGIEVNDPLTGLLTTIDTLIAGEAVTFYENYTIKAADLSAGSVINTATAITEHPQTGVISESDQATIYYEADVSPITITVVTADVLCFGENTGSAEVFVSGGVPPYTIAWNTNPVQHGQVAENLSAGTYKVTVEDAENNTASATFTIHQTDEPVAISSQTGHVYCHGGNDGFIALEVSGGTSPYSFNWSNGSDSQNLTGLTSGTYTLTLEDNNGCILEETFVITGPDPLSIDNIEITGVYYKHEAAGSISFDVFGGTPPYTYNWSIGYATAGLSNIPGGDYYIEIVDSNGCTLDYNFFVPWETEAEDIAIPQGFSPNDDGFNDLWVIGGLEAFPQTKVQIFNRYGTLVFEAEPYNNDWDGIPNRGSFTGSDGKLPSGTYYYIITQEPGKKPLSGWLYIAR
ncbi:MAG: HYR domain-containing protein, partial [Bacteroidetes bacterium]